MTQPQEKRWRLFTLKAESGKALTNFYASLKIRPTAEAHIAIAAIQTIRGNFRDSVEHYLAALQLSPDSPDILNNLAWLLTTCPDARVGMALKPSKMPNAPAN